MENDEVEESPEREISIKKRIVDIHRDIWIECPQAIKILNSIFAMLEARGRTTAPCMLIYGAGGSGKTTIVNQLKKKNKALGLPFAFLSLAENPGNVKFRQLILEGIGIPSRITQGKGFFERDVANYIHSQGIRALVVDEFHEALLVTRSEQLKNLSLLKKLTGDPFNLMIVVFGTHSARNALQCDDQLARRFDIQELAPWGLNEDFRNFVATLEHSLKLGKPSNLHHEDTLRHIHFLSKGTMDYVVRIVKTAAIYAVINGKEQITKELIEKAFLDPWGYNN
ncbi:TPA: TniB family NTP-binding protein [Pseudomonas aeruginosa]